MSRLSDALAGALRWFSDDAPRAPGGANEPPLPGDLLARTHEGEYETRALSILRQERTIGIEVLIERVAEEAYRADLRAGGAVVDIGVWGPLLYRREATAAVCRLVGRTLVLEDDGGPLAVQAAWA